MQIDEVVNALNHDSNIRSGALDALCVDESNAHEGNCFFYEDADQIKCSTCNYVFTLDQAKDAVNSAPEHAKKLLERYKR